MQQLEMDDLVTALKAAAEPTRLRILVLLQTGELNVKDLTQILGQSQPRLSRHLKLLTEAGLVERFREGSWVYFFISEQTTGGRLARQLLQSVSQDDPVIVRDRDRANTLKREREALAQEYFEANASEWDRIRARHINEADVEASLKTVLADKACNLLVDLGTGTGRILELFADNYRQGLGVDVNHAMLAYARSKLAADGLSHAQVRHGDIYSLALGEGEADVVVMHQVLHFLSEPQKAISEAARILAPGGRLVIADFAPHTLEVLRDAQAHDRLGFPSSQVSQWLQEAGLRLTRSLDVKPQSSDADDGEKLTVSIWLAEQTKQMPSGRRKGPDRVLEEAHS